MRRLSYIRLLLRESFSNESAVVRFTSRIIGSYDFCVNKVFLTTCFFFLFFFLAQVKFTSECPAQGNRNYISVNDLYARNFTDPNGEFQLELSMGHVRTVFDSEFRIPTSFLGHHLAHRGHHHHGSGGTPASTLTNIKTASGTVTKVETSYFFFAGFEWNIALYPQGIKEAHGKYTRMSVCARKISNILYFIASAYHRK